MADKNSLPGVLSSGSILINRFIVRALQLRLCPIANGLPFRRSARPRKTCSQEAVNHAFCTAKLNCAPRLFETRSVPATVIGERVVLGNVHERWW